MGRKLNVAYVEENRSDYDKDRHKLDIFCSENESGSSVLIFIHGGTWISGSKDLYRDLGQNLAKKGITTVLINYRLATDFRIMAGDCSRAVAWVYNNIESFGGNKERIYLCGHSAGGHLASLIALDPMYFSNLSLANPVKGCILIDAFGLNIGAYISDHGAFYMHYISQVFTTDSSLWKKASPINFLQNVNMPFLIYTGKDTYPFLLQDNKTLSIN